MTLRLRRGTNTQRQSIVFAEGELIYTTDTQEIYVGDGLTLGGILVTNSTLSSPPALLQNLNLNNYDILGSGNISATTISGDGSGLTNVPISPTLTQNLDINGWNISGNGSISVTSISGNGSGLTNVPISPTLTQNLDINGWNIFGTGNIILSGDVFATSFIGDGSGLTNLPTGQGVVSGLDYNINIVGDDSTRIVNVTNNTFTGNFIGDGNGLTNLSLFGDYNINIIGDDSTRIIDVVNNTVTGNFVGDLSGSVFAIDSSLIVDGIFGDVYPRQIVTPEFLRIRGNNDGITTRVQIESKDQFTALQLIRDSDSDISGSNLRYGQIRFGRDDVNGIVTTGIISANRDFIWFAHTASGSVVDADIVTITNQKLGIGTVTPAATLDVRGDAIIAGNLTAAAFKGSLVLDNSTIIVDGMTGNVFANTLTSGALYLSGSNIDTTDSSLISITPSVTFNSDVTVQNDLIVTNKIIVETIEVQNIITSASGTPEIASDTDIILSAGTRVEISSSPFKLASFTTGERDALSAQNGDMIYNTDANKFQGYAGGVWVNLH